MKMTTSSYMYTQPVYYSNYTCGTSNSSHECHVISKQGHVTYLEDEVVGEGVLDAANHILGLTLCQLYRFI